MAYNYPELEVRLNNAASDVSQSKQRFEKAIQQIDVVYSVLDELGTTYAQVLSDLDDALAANPTDPGWINLDARRDKIVAAALTLKADVLAVKNAIEGVG